MATTAGIAAAAQTPLVPHTHRRVRRRSTRVVSRRATDTEREKPDVAKDDTYEGTMLARATDTEEKPDVAKDHTYEGTTVGTTEVPRLLGVSLSRYAGSGAAMLRNGGVAVRHHVAVARGDTNGVTRPLSWSPMMTIGVEILAGFLEGIAIADEEVAALRFRRNGNVGTDDPQSADRLLVYLRSLRAMMAVGVPPLLGTRVQRVTIGDADGIPAVWLTPNSHSWNSKRAPQRVLLWFHGGAFVLCNTNTHARLLSSLGVAGETRVLSVEYPLAPDQGTHENMVDAADRAYKWLVSPHGGNVLPENVVIGGDSAGGHLACGLAQRLAPSVDGGENGDVAPPAGLVLLSPWLDPERELETTKKAWADASATSVDYLRAVEGSMSCVVELVFGDTGDGTTAPRCLLDPSLYAGKKMPPCLIQCGGVEVLAGESKTLADLAAAAGWDVTLEVAENMPHVFQVLDSVSPQGGEAIESAGQFIKRRTRATEETI